ncbi:MAG: hypothetical protein AAF591_14710 [Verrucomicrobiota bacterium]
MAGSEGKKSFGTGLLKLLLVALLVVMVLVVGLVAGAGMWIKGYLRGETFRELAGIKTSDAFRAEGEYEAISWTGSSSVYSDGYSARGLPESTFTKIDAEGIRAQTNVGDLISFWNLLRFWELSGQALEIPEISVNRLTLQAETQKVRPIPIEETATAEDAGPAPPLPVDGRVGSGGDAVETPTLGSVDGGSAEAVSEVAEVIEEDKGFFASLAPQEVNLEKVNIAETNVFVTEGGERKLAITGVATRLQPMDGTDYEGWRVTGTGGKVMTEGMPDLEIESINTNFRGSDVYITDAGARIFENGMITGSGEMHFGGDEGTMDLRLKIGDIDVAHIVDEEWRSRVQGVLSGDVRVTGNPGEVETQRKAGKLSISKGVVENVPVLDQIANYAKAERFRRLVLTKVTADFESLGEETVFRNIDVESDGLTRILGTVLVKGELIRGDLRVGVTPGTLQWIPGAEQQVFTESAEGYLWTNVKIGGTLDKIDQDLSGRLMSAAAGAIVGVPIEGAENAQDVMQEVGKQLTEEISRQTGKDAKEIEETAEKLWDNLRKSFLGQ